MDSDNIYDETREAESTKTEKSKAIVEEGVNNLLGPYKEVEFPYKIRDCFKNAVDCQEFDGNIQSGMKKIIERYYIASREKYEKKFKDDMKIILDLSVNYSKEDLMKMLQEPIVVQGTVVVQEGPYPNNHPKPLTQEEVLQQFIKMEKGTEVSQEFYDLLKINEKESWFDKKIFNYDLVRFPSNSTEIDQFYYVKKDGPTAQIP